MTHGSKYKIESELKNTAVTRISKSMLLNVSKLKSVAPFPNHRMDGEFTNGEHVIISRSCIAGLKEKIRRV